VYFDDLKVTHTKSNVIQYNEYYPFGLQTASSWTREDSKNNFLYNAGSELNSTTGFYEMFYRGYDPTLGRMLQVDPYANAFASLTPYNYAGNNPVSMNDPSGGYMRVNPESGEFAMYEFQPATRRVSYSGTNEGFSDWASQYRDMFLLKSAEFEEKYDESILDYRSSL
jgi:RHS repeat-associated protein